MGKKAQFLLGKRSGRTQHSAAASDLCLGKTTPCNFFYHRPRNGQKIGILGQSIRLQIGAKSFPTGLFQCNKVGDNRSMSGNSQPDALINSLSVQKYSLCWLHFCPCLDSRLLPFPVLQTFPISNFQGCSPSFIY